ncbi:polynucleotide kinase-3'-phosphatase [Capsaspora owczarzaki ATCC 30864]|uniref:Polynucleotide kinase-3'-phosphatase n=1 Tax=Capsaspora owczarzaki (strain ATCC 30864) TaxID=595528 RepID=A0A0D2X4D0_CAPO3|nr:polynucleotide kinase-3'-phosphatase [Capsaspora owczarzaki ATCC 30864]KJE95844.1 polynucleotide kinase-3'-phosphatase [Capsaspora owczarzaki ATCC 30864]|eukprot:XP_004344997.2 polynucleotide kinase-3'-phosphatase [Capsaspora owczarzaki ATCC 30864]
MFLSEITRSFVSLVSASVAASVAASAAVARSTASSTTVTTAATAAAAAALSSSAAVASLKSNHQHWFASNLSQRRFASLALVAAQRTQAQPQPQAQSSSSSSSHSHPTVTATASATATAIAATAQSIQSMSTRSKRSATAAALDATPASTSAASTASASTAAGRRSKQPRLDVDLTADDQPAAAVSISKKKSSSAAASAPSAAAATPMDTKWDASTDDDDEPVAAAAAKTQRSVASALMPRASASTSAGIAGKWTMVAGSLLRFDPDDLVHSSKIIGFDLDDTLITTKSGKSFAVNSGDWKWLHPDVPTKLRELHANGTKLVIFSNQKGMTGGQVNPEDWKRKVSAILADLGVPMQVFAAMGTDQYRKPSTGTWELLTLGTANGKVPVDASVALYIGDAAGRAANWAPGRKKDFSDSDRKFALNLGIGFHTPEEFFFKHQPAPFKLAGSDPKEFVNAFKNLPLFTPTTASLTAPKQELIVMTGFPASGKSTFVRQKLVPAGYVHINRDTLGTWQKCVAATRDALRAGKSVVVDNTSPDTESRGRYVAEAKALGIPARAFVMNTTYEHALHNNAFREATDPTHEHVSRIGFNMYRSKYSDPTAAEGFTEVLRINFAPAFTDADLLRRYSQWMHS